MRSWKQWSDCSEYLMSTHELCDSSLHMCLCRELLPALTAQTAKSGALHMLQRLLNGLGLEMVSFLNLLVVPIMGLTSDSAPAVRAAATSAFAAAVALLPLAQVRLHIRLTSRQPSHL